MVGNLFGMHQALSSFPSTQKKKNKIKLDDVLKLIEVLLNSGDEEERIYLPSPKNFLEALLLAGLTPVTPVFRRQRQEDHRLQVNKSISNKTKLIIRTFKEPFLS